MEYTVQQLSRLSGVSPRTLRYYHQIGLLRPDHVGDNGYRYYGRAQVDRLQQILFYRALGLPLERIGAVLADPAFDRVRTLEEHLQSLAAQRDRLDQIIRTLRKTIREAKGGCKMQDNERFEGLRQQFLEENEADYGQEIREKYGEEIVEGSLRRMKGLSQETWARGEGLSRNINAALKEAMAQGDPKGEEAQALCRLHRDWITLYWPEGAYTKEAHRGLGELYASDERFRAYYEKAAGPGAAAFLCRALAEFCDT